jgi:hypothetical protein
MTLRAGVLIQDRQIETRTVERAAVHISWSAIRAWLREQGLLVPEDMRVTTATDGLVVSWTRDETMVQTGGKPEPWYVLAFVDGRYKPHAGPFSRRRDAEARRPEPQDKIRRIDKIRNGAYRVGAVADPRTGLWSGRRMSSGCSSGSSCRCRPTCRPRRRSEPGGRRHDVLAPRRG